MEAKGTEGLGCEQPTAGRIVHYGVKLRMSDEREEVTACAAIVVCVLVAAGKLRTVLRVLQPGGDDMIDLDAVYSPDLAENCWTWPRRTR